MLTWHHLSGGRPIRHLESLQADSQPLASSPVETCREDLGREQKPLRIALLGYRSQPHAGGQGVYLRYLSKALADAPLSLLAHSKKRGKRSRMDEVLLVQAKLRLAPSKRTEEKEWSFIR